MCTSPAATRGSSSASPSACKSARRFASAAAGQELDAEPKAPGEALAQPAAVLRLARQQRPAGLRQPEDQTSFERILEIPALEDIVALGPSAPRAGDQPGERAIARAVGGERHELERIDAVELRPDDERQLALLGRDVRTHHARERALIGERERSIVQVLGLRDELLAVRGAAQKREIAQRMQLGVHARASSEHTVQIPTPRPPLLKNPQSRSPRFDARCNSRGQSPCRPTSRSRCARDLPRCPAPRESGVPRERQLRRLIQQPDRPRHVGMGLVPRWPAARR
jgi:hypothetical protein